MMVPKKLRVQHWPVMSEMVSGGATDLPHLAATSLPATEKNTATHPFARQSLTMRKSQLIEVPG
jgi:hypothetical protein